MARGPLRVVRGYSFVSPDAQEGYRSPRMTPGLRSGHGQSASRDHRRPSNPHALFERPTSRRSPKSSRRDSTPCNVRTLTNDRIGVAFPRKVNPLRADHASLVAALDDLRRLSCERSLQTASQPPLADHLTKVYFCREPDGCVRLAFATVPRHTAAGAFHAATSRATLTTPRGHT